MRLLDPPRSESDLALAAARLIEAEVGAACVFEEIDLRWTAPDLIAVVPAVLDPLSPRHRPFEVSFKALQPEALTIAELLEETGPLDRTSFEQQTSLRWSVFLREVLEPLAEQQIISSDGIHWRFQSWPRPLFSEFHSVELKLKDWRGAILQASRNQLFSDSSWIAMPTSRVSRGCLEAAAELGIGVIAVEDESGKVVLRAQRCGALHASLRRLVEEHLRDTLTQDERRTAGSPMRAGDQRTLSQTSRKSGLSPGSQGRLIVA